jgi:hypothetical protein
MPQDEKRAALLRDRLGDAWVEVTLTAPDAHLEDVPGVARLDGVAVIAIDPEFDSDPYWASPEVSLSRRPTPGGNGKSSSWPGPVA